MQCYWHQSAFVVPYREKSIEIWTSEEAVEKLMIELNSDDDEDTDDNGEDVHGLPSRSLCSMSLREAP